MESKVYFLAFLSLSLTSFAGEPLEISDIREANSVIDKHIEILADATNALTLEDVRSEDFHGKFRSLNDLGEQYSVSDTYWLHLSLENSGHRSHPLGLDIPNYNHLADVYFIGDSVFPVRTTGFYRSGEANLEIIPLTDIIALPDLERIEVYVRIQNITDERPDFRLRVVDIGQQVKRNLAWKIFDAFLLGMMGIMMLYGLFLYYHHRDRLYIYYVLYIIFLVLWYVVCFEFGYSLFSSLPRIIYPYSDIFAFIGMLYYIQFVKTFIKIPDTLPRWNRILTLFQYAIAGIIIIVPVFMLVTSRIYAGYMINAGSSLVMFIIFSLLIITLFRSDIQFSNVIAIASAFLLLGLLIGTLRYLFFYDYSLFYQKLGTILELIVFTYGISLRYRVVEQEKELYQRQVIEQLEENTRIQEKANRELEARVQERTQEIAEKNQVLTDQNEEIKAQRDLLFQQHNSIQESIRYASNIQSAILPSDESILHFLPKHFILFKPRDIVSGDFYWLGLKEDKVILAVADCTGHGVPGAFMSMLGSSLLNEILNSAAALHANEILDELRDHVILSLRQTGKPGEAKDGMDMSLTIIDFKNRQLQFTGANSNLIHVRKGVLTELKGDRMPIGISSSAGKPFQKHDLALSKGDTIYMFSDGFPDQFGGPEGKKFLKSRLKELLLSLQDKIMHEQREILDRTLFDWMNPAEGKQKAFEQVDDILVIGVRI
jgi:serine phosphatase RsbU (regulator of sigma subunit)